MKIIRTITFIPVGIILLSIADVINLHIFVWVFSFQPLIMIIAFPFASALQGLLVAGALWIGCLISPFKKFAFWFFGILFIVGSIVNVFKHFEDIPNWINIYVRLSNIFYFLIGLTSIIGQLKDKEEENILFKEEPEQKE